MGDDVKQVKVDNWGIYFLQRLKHFFNRTDYCDLTLQFQDNAQLKVHRLVLSACTEYFELLERTCEMYEDCLVMPEDLQADIVVPIVNFMYTGQLEFKMDLLERLYQCSEIMNMPVLTKLLDSHRPKPKVIQNYIPAVKKPVKHVEGVKQIVKSISATELVTTSPITYKRSHNKAFTEKTTVYRDKKVYLPVNKVANNGFRAFREPSPIPLDQRYSKKVVSGEPRPTRYELPEELDTENIFENSFCNISYTSQPLQVHPETRKQYAKRPKLGEASTSKKFGGTVDILQCKKPKPPQDPLFEDTTIADEADLFSEQFTSKPGSSRDTNQLFDQILEKKLDSKLTIETKNTKLPASLDHAKIISEVLKKYPHLVKSNKNIKLKILNTPSKAPKKQKSSPVPSVAKPIKIEKEVDFTFETDVLDSMQAAKLIALGAENIEGPWICLICGTPGKAMNFTSYYKFRCHLIDVHNEKPVLNICEYCGQKSTKRNYLLHHLYTKHGVEPPPQYRFPKCNNCNYIALTEALLVKHKLSHAESKKFRCNGCPAAFHSSAQLLAHIQNTGHKYTTERKSNFQCIYCQKNFLRETNLCAHLKTNHRVEAIQDGIIDDSDDEREEEKAVVKSEPILNEFQEMDIQYQIQQRPDGNINIVTKTSPEKTQNAKQTILNSGLSGQVSGRTHINKAAKRPQTAEIEYIQDVSLTAVNDAHEEIVMIDNTEYIMRDNQLIPRKSKEITREYVLSDHGLQSVTPTTSMEFTNQDNIQHANIFLKNSDNITESIPIYVSNEEEYKALMASNQPIIFDSGDSNKTLTVLTAPHTSTLDTTIDLNTAQPNDMMIIQDNYPQNVSDAVTSNNSNIVVVYSHQVTGDNKQYQLLTTQGLGAQFVQSSAIITQNFETVTTTTPILNTQALQKQVEEVWQRDLHQIVNTDQIEITRLPVNQVVKEPPKEMQVSNIESNNEISDLPHVELPSNIKETTDDTMDITSANQSQEDMITEEIMQPIIDENTEVVCEDNMQNTSIMEVSNEALIEHEVEETVDTNESPEIGVENIVEQEEIDPKSDTVEDTELIESQKYTQSDMESHSYSQTEATIEPVVENMGVSEHQSDQMINDIQTAEDEIVQEDNEVLASEPNYCKDADNTEQIGEDGTEKELINSKWSEKNIQDPQEESLAEITSHVDSCAEVTNEQDNTLACEIEESIENIQQEVDKQMAAVQTEQEISEEITENEITDEGDVANSSQDESDYVQENSVPVIVDPVVAQEKISSLLNDWEDNDSQEDNESANENAPTMTDENADGKDETTETENPEKQDKIKSLVSDWDEDEEELKNDT